MTDKRVPPEGRSPFPLLLPLLLPLTLLLLGAEAAGTVFHLTATDQAYTGSPLQTAPGGGVTQCALRCALRDGCAAFQQGGQACLLLSEAPGQDRLTAAAGTRIFVGPWCPAEWKKVGNACYRVFTPDNTEATWSEDSQFCQSQNARLPTFETEEQFGFIANTISGTVWMNIGYVGGRYQALDGSTSTFWTQKWAPGEPGGSATGFVFYHPHHKMLLATSSTISRVGRYEVVCMVPSQITSD